MLVGSVVNVAVDSDVAVTEVIVVVGVDFVVAGTGVAWLSCVVVIVAVVVEIVEARDGVVGGWLVVIVAASTSMINFCSSKYLQFQKIFKASSYSYC